MENYRVKARDHFSLLQIIRMLCVLKEDTQNIFAASLFKDMIAIFLSTTFEAHEGRLLLKSDINLRKTLLYAL